MAGLCPARQRVLPSLKQRPGQSFLTTKLRQRLPALLKLPHIPVPLFLAAPSRKTAPCLLRRPAGNRVLPRGKLLPRYPLRTTKRRHRQPAHLIPLQQLRSLRTGAVFPSLASICRLLPLPDRVIAQSLTTAKLRHRQPALRKSAQHIRPLLCRAHPSSGFSHPRPLRGPLFGWPLFLSFFFGLRCCFFARHPSYDTKLTPLRLHVQVARLLCFVRRLAARGNLPVEKPVNPGCRDSPITVPADAGRGGPELGAVRCGRCSILRVSGFFGAAALSKFSGENQGKPDGSAALITIRRMPEWRDREAGKIVAS
ncbi:hypothetical protein OpiT1DRAFT_01997 [Opitutaceae bacterium TAV1]|nr:hypothetical protein OpiT1DRAFT_01997 [Opitutaceae bacterium TAV1]